MPTESPRRRYADTHWTVDRHIPIALIMTLLLQTAGVVWWAATLSSRVDALEKLVNAATSERYRAGEARADFALRDARISYNAQETGEVKEVVVRIDGKIDRLLERFASNGQ